MHVIVHKQHVMLMSICLSTCGIRRARQVCCSPVSTRRSRIRREAAEGKASKGLTGSLPVPSAANVAAACDTSTFAVGIFGVHVGFPRASHPPCWYGRGNQEATETCDLIRVREGWHQTEGSFHRASHDIGTLIARLRRHCRGGHGERCAEPAATPHPGNLQPKT